MVAYNLLLYASAYVLEFSRKRSIVKESTYDGVRF